MADKGFRVDTCLAEKGIALNLPHFSGCNVQFTPEQVALNEEIACLRIYVERFSRRVKEITFCDRAIPLPKVVSLFSTVHYATGPLTTESPEALSWHSYGVSFWWR